ncbi:hypothetical protein, partial [Escherichia coli]|uniref:hypothetical protein n=1 Tax=Escherichia coli TaxID=562 RepID=UPI003CE79E1D
SAGPDGTLQTNCGNSTPVGDDQMVYWPVATAIQRSAVWQTTTGTSGTQAQFGQVGSQLIVDSTGDLTVPGTMGVAGASTFQSNLGV